MVCFDVLGLVFFGALDVAFFSLVFPLDFLLFDFD